MYLLFGNDVNTCKVICSLCGSRVRQPILMYTEEEDRQRKSLEGDNKVKICLFVSTVQHNFTLREGTSIIGIVKAFNLQNEGGVLGVSPSFQQLKSR